MAPSLLPLLICDTPCPSCFGLYTLGDVSRHVKNADPPTSFVSQACHVVLSLWVSSFHVFLIGFILLFIGVGSKLVYFHFGVV
jgi:hypothetical protein